MSLQNLLTRLAILHDGLTQIGVQAAKLCFTAVLVLYCIDVIGRYFFGVGTWWSNEFVPYIVCAGVFLMMPAVTRAKGHVAIGVLDGLLPARYAAYSNLLIVVISLLVCTVIAWMSFNENVRQATNDIRILRVLATPKVFVSVWITYGFASSAIYFLRMLASARLSDPPPASAPGAL